jgi:hypothetical protein
LTGRDLGAAKREMQCCGELAQSLHALAANLAAFVGQTTVETSSFPRSAAMKISELLTALSLPPILLGLAMLFAAGCDNKETVLDVETPEGQVEVERDRDTGAIGVDAAEDEDQLIDSDIPGADVEVNRDDKTGDVEVE